MAIAAVSWWILRHGGTLATASVMSMGSLAQPGIPCRSFSSFFSVIVGLVRDSNSIDFLAAASISGFLDFKSPGVLSCTKVDFVLVYSLLFKWHQSM
eukprot:g22321.t1